MAIRMLREEVTNKAAHEILNTLEASAHRGSGIVQQVLSLARGVEGEKDHLPGKASPFRSGHDREMTLFPAPLSISVSKIGKKDIWPIVETHATAPGFFSTVCLNARDAMPNGGRLQVEAQNCTIDENLRSDAAEAKPGPYVVVTIADTGVGIPTEPD